MKNDSYTWLPGTNENYSNLGPQLHLRIWFRYAYVPLKIKELKHEVGKCQKYGRNDDVLKRQKQTTE